MDRNQELSVAKLLEEVLSNTYVLYVKTQNLHWNVVDPRFYSLHLFLEKQYTEMAEQIDEIAERIRMLNCRSPGSMKEFLSRAKIRENYDDLDPNTYLQNLAQDHTYLADDLREKIAKAQDFGDEGTADLFIKLLRDNEKMAWMLNSTIASLTLA